MVCLYRKIFQSTPPERGATPSDLISLPMRCYFNPRPPSGERPDMPGIGTPLVSISIHAPRAGSDLSESMTSLLFTDFNPRPPSGERLWDIWRFYCFVEFQSTPPERGATGYTGGYYPYQIPISIHAPRAGSDDFSLICMILPCIFQSTPPERGATFSRHILNILREISIHAPRAGSDR